MTAWGKFIVFFASVGVFIMAVCTMLVIIFMLAGCGIIPIQTAFDRGQTLTPDQITALRANDLDVYSCIFIAGPPPAGRAIWIIVPRGSAVTMPKCQE